MDKWIYLKKASPLDGLALATVLSKNEEKWNVIHSSMYSFFLQQIPNVKLGHAEEYPNGILVLDLSNYNSFLEKCNSIAFQIGQSKRNTWNVYSLFTERSTELENRLMSYGHSIFLHCMPQKDKHINLITIDRAMRHLKGEGYSIIDGNSEILPNVRGTRDFRGLIDVETILRLKDNIAIVITTESWLGELCQLFNVKNLVLCAEQNSIKIDDIMIDHPLQLYNYIQNKINTK